MEVRMDGFQWNTSASQDISDSLEVHQNAVLTAPEWQEEPSVQENNDGHFSSSFNPPQSTKDKQKQNKKSTRNVRKNSQLRATGEKTEESRSTRNRYVDGCSGSPYRRRSTSRTRTSPDVNLYIQGSSSSVLARTRETSIWSNVADEDQFSQNTINAVLLDNLLFDAQSNYMNADPHIKEDQTKQVQSASAFTYPLKPQISNANVMVESPDSGFHYNGSSLLSSPSTYRRNPEWSSGFESDMDTSDQGTPVSENVMISTQKTQKMEETGPKQNTTAKLRKYLQVKYVGIKDELDPEELADSLYSKDLIRKGDREKITELKFRPEKCDKLIKSLVRKSEKTDAETDETFVKQVIHSFKEAKYGYIFKDFEEFKEANDLEELPLDNTWKGKLSYFSTTKGDEIDPTEVIDELLARGVLTFDEHQAILDANTKNNKLACLVESIRGKTRKHFNKFSIVMREEYPEASKMLFDESIYEKMDTTFEGDGPPIVEMKLLKMKEHYQGETAVKMTFRGKEGAEVELEKMIVDQHSPNPSEKFAETVMDDIHCEFKVSFSCIKITLKCFSERSRMLLLEKCKTTPPYFLEQWIKELIGADRIKLLKQKNVSEVKVEISVTWPEYIITTHDIARNYSYLRKNLEPRDYGDILIGVDGAEDIIKLIMTEEATEVRCKEFILYMVTCDHAPVERFSGKLKGTKVLEHLIRQKRSTACRCCTCKLTKRTIVENFTFLEQQVENVEEIVDIFAKFRGFEKVVQSQFQAVKAKESRTSKTAALLHKILDLPDDGFQVCLFEAALIRTNQESLLRAVLNKAAKVDECLITKDDIRRNRTFLQQELEPMRFIPMLSDESDTAIVREKILEADSRRQRCSLFLDYLKECDMATMTKFSSELWRLHLTNIISYLISSRHQGTEENKITKDDISQNRSFLGDMLDPMALRHILTDNKHDKSRQALDNVLSSSKKKRCKVFLDVILNSEEVVFKKFTTYLENHMPDIIKFLVCSREQQDTEMQLLMESLLDAYKSIVSEIEPKRLKKMFVERQVISDSDFESLCLNPTRRGRAIELMRRVLKGPASNAQCFVEALASAGYKSLVNQIKDEQDTFKPCSRLYRVDNDINECVSFEGVVDIKFEKPAADNTEGYLMLNSSLDINKGQYICQWLNTSDFKGSDVELNKLPTNAQKSTVERHESTDTKQERTKQPNTAECNGGQINYSPAEKNWLFCFSPTSSLNCRRIDEMGDICSQSDISKSLTTLNFVEEDSRFTDSPTFSDLVVNVDPDLICPDLTVIGDKSIKSPDHQPLKSTNKITTETQDCAVKTTCSCNICSVNVSPNDSKMGVCTRHALYYIK